MVLVVEGEVEAVGACNETNKKIAPIRPKSTRRRIRSVIIFASFQKKKKKKKKVWVTMDVVTGAASDGDDDGNGGGLEGKTGAHL